MKKTTLILAAVAALAFTGCGDDKTPAPAPVIEQPVEEGISSETEYSNFEMEPKNVVNQSFVASNNEGNPCIKKETVRNTLSKITRKNTDALINKIDSNATSVMIQVKYPSRYTDAEISLIPYSGVGCETANRLPLIPVDVIRSVDGTFTFDFNHPVNKGAFTKSFLENSFLFSKIKYYNDKASDSLKTFNAKKARNAYYTKGIKLRTPVIKMSSFSNIDLIPLDMAENFSLETEERVSMSRMSALEAAVPDKFFENSFKTGCVDGKDITFAIYPHPDAGTLVLNKDTQSYDNAACSGSSTLSSSHTAIGDGDWVYNTTTKTLNLGPNVPAWGYTELTDSLVFDGVQFQNDHP